MKFHINQLPLRRNYAILDEKFKDKLMHEFMVIARTKYNANKLTGISRPTISKYINQRKPTIRLDYLFIITKIINNDKFNLNNLEKNIIWIGANNSKGIFNPRLPFHFNSRSSARFLAAICNDGCCTVGYRKDNKFSYGRLIYNNNEESLRKSISKDAEFIFGKNVSKEFHRRNEFFLVFPSVIRDVIEVITEFKGKKSVNNPSIPSLIFEDNELIYGWIEQTIADEGHISFIPNKYRREVIWRRSFNKNLDEYKLNKGEKMMLDKIGIKYNSWNIGSYQTKKGIEKIRLQMRLARKSNILKLSKLIRIPDKKKQKTFETMVNSF